MGALLLVGTRKGLFLVRGDDERRSFARSVTVGDALRSLPVRDLLERDLEAAVGAASKIRIVAAIAGG